MKVQWKIGVVLKQLEPSHLFLIIMVAGGADVPFFGMSAIPPAFGIGSGAPYEAAIPQARDRCYRPITSTSR